jgi:two-component system nitrate/nitrite response regulator NarL
LKREGTVIKVVVADDHPIYREGVARLLRRRREFELVAECRDGEDALAAIKSSAPDIALVNVRLPRLSGIDVLRRLRKSHTDTRVVMLSDAADGATSYESIAAGAAGYLLKDADGPAICESLLAVAAGGTVLPPEVHTGLADAIRHQAEPRPPMLSQRELQVLRLAAKGGTAQQIAKELAIGTTTVKTHLQHIYAKLGVSDRVSAVAEAIHQGIVD